MRIHGKLARIEIEKSELNKFLASGTMEQIACYFHEIGFLYVTLDLDGYRMGSMNKALEL